MGKGIGLLLGVLAPAVIELVRNLIWKKKTMSVKEMFVLPKDTYFSVMQNVSEVQKQEIDAINVDKVNVSCGSLLIRLKKNAKETALKKKRKIERANSATSLTKPSPAEPHGITVSPFLTPPTPSSSIAVKKLTPPTPTPATATTTTTTCLLYTSPSPRD